MALDALAQQKDTALCPQLLAQFVAGDRDALRQVYGLLATPLLRTLQPLHPGPLEGHRALLGTWLRLYRARYQLDVNRPSELVPWATALSAKDLASTTFHEDSRSRPMSATLAEHDRSRSNARPVGEDASSGQQPSLAAIVARLRPRDQALFEACFAQELADQALAASLGISERRARQSRKRLLNRLLGLLVQWRRESGDGQFRRGHALDAAICDYFAGALSPPELHTLLEALEAEPAAAARFDSLALLLRQAARCDQSRTERERLWELLCLRLDSGAEPTGSVPLVRPGPTLKLVTAAALSVGVGLALISLLSRPGGHSTSGGALSARLAAVDVALVRGAEGPPGPLSARGVLRPLSEVNQSERLQIHYRNSSDARLLYLMGFAVDGEGGIDLSRPQSAAPPFGGEPLRISRQDQLQALGRTIRIRSKVARARFALVAIFARRPVASAGLRVLLSGIQQLGGPGGELGSVAGSVTIVRRDYRLVRPAASPPAASPPATSRPAASLPAPRPALSIPALRSKR